MPFRPYEQNQSFLFPPRLSDWVTDDYPARVFCELMDKLPVGGFKDAAVEGRPRCDTPMMLKVLLWAYANGIRASRKIEKRLHPTSSSCGCPDARHPTFMPLRLLPMQ